MKVLHVYKSFYPDSVGGVEQSILNLAVGCEVHGVYSEVFTLSRKPRSERFKNKGVFITQARTNFELASTPFSAEAVSKFKTIAPAFDLIHYHHPYPFCDIIKLSTCLKKPSIVTYHSDIVRQRLLKLIYAPLQAVFLNSVDRIVCTSDTYLRTSNTLQKYRSKTSPVPLGLDENSLPKPKTEVLLKWQKKLGQPFLLFLGVLRSYKGINTLLKAAKNLDSKLVIAGDGPELARLQRQSHKLNLGNIYFTGRVDEDDKVALLDLCTCLVLPSHLRSEAFGLVQVEASMRSKPLICTELGTGTSFVNEHNNTGLVVPPRNAYALSKAMNFMVGNPKIASRMGQNAYRRYKKLFSAERMCDQYVNIYDDVMATYLPK